MPIDTNLNVSPYYDDFDEQKNFHRVLFRPSVAVQARELTQLQTILQNQVERFGDNIFKIGTIIKGCSLNTDYSYNYIKINDNQNDGQPVNVNLFANCLLVQETSNLQSVVVNSVAGLQSTDPDLNTLYIKYLNTGLTGQKVYAASDTVKVFNRLRTVEDIIIFEGGTLYSNSDTITISGNTGSGATATLTTDANGKITDVSVISKGTSYTTTPTITINTSTGTGANIVAQNYIAEITVASVSYSNSVGVGTAVKSTDGVIYHKGNFIRVDAQEAIVEKYSSSPNNAVVGFATDETIINSNIDSSLLDNASGSSNFSAPGANRLKLTPRLVTLTSDNAQANGDFLALLEYEDGKLIKDRTGTQFNSVNKELSRRTFEESGNYVINTIPLDTEDRSSNTTHFNLVVGSGISYVNGERVELLNNVRVPVKKGTDTANNVNQTINTLFGSYVLVDELLGIFDVKNSIDVVLRSTAANDVTDNAGGVPTTPSSNIGTAKIRSLIYDSGVPGTPDCRYKMFLFDIKLAKGASFKDVKSISVDGVSIADAVLNTAGQAELRDIENDILVFYTGTNAIKELNAEEFIFRTSTNSTFTSGGSASISFSGGNTIPYGVGTLNDATKSDFIIVPVTSFSASANNPGTVNANTGTAVVTGTSTTFTSSYQVGDYIVIGDSLPNRIASITNDNSLTLAANFTGLTTGGTANAVSNGHLIAYPANVPIDFTKPGKSITINTTTSLTVDVGHSLNATPTFVMYHDLENFEPAVRLKTLNNPVYVKISTDSLGASGTGPWNLGIPDVLSLEAVYVGTSNTYSETGVNYVSDFELDNGQKDNYYGLASIKKSPSSTLSLSGSNCLLIKLKCFTHGAGKYLSTESYPVDDVTSPLPSNKIRTEDIPVYVSTTSGEALDLRNSIDFRPIAQNTAPLSSTEASAAVDPPFVETLATGEKFFPSPTRSFECSIQSYLERIDRVVLSNNGRVRVIQGTPSNSPSAPPSERGTMDLGIIRVAPFPSLSSKAANASKRHDLKNTITLLQTKRYTMKDISDIESRIQRLEYYSLLNTLEADTKSLTITSEANPDVEVFKNGFFVDSFNNYVVSNLNDAEYKALVDSARSRLIPQQEVVKVDLKYNTSSTNAQKTGDLVTLEYTETPLISQTRATKTRSLVEQNYRYAGKMHVIPRVDNFFDTEISATSSIDINIADPLTSLVNAQNQINSKLIQNSELLSSVNVGEATLVNTNQTGNIIERTFSQNIAQTFTDTNQKITTAPVVTSTKELGEFLTSVHVTPYIRPQRICLYASGLRPGAEHYVYFDSVDLTSSSIPAKLSNFTNPSIGDFVPLYNKGASPGIFANNTGEVAVIVDLPENTFTTGEKTFLIMDFNSLDSESSATSKATGKFSSFSISGQSTSLTMSTKTFDLSAGGFGTSTFTTQRVVNSSTTFTELEVVAPPEPVPTGGGDPLCQTFIVQKQTGGDVVYVTSVDLYFSQKDQAKGVAVEIREVNESGYPTQNIVPFSTSYKRSSEVNVSSTAATATRFTFNSPVGLRVGLEYAIVILPDGNSPDYRIWTSQPGSADVSNNSIITNQSWGLGTMFFSTTNRAFSAVQDEDIKFTVNRALFNPLTGTVTLNNEDYEFLTINAVSGTFRGGEVVGQMSNSYLNATLTTNTSSYVIQTSSSLTSQLTSNDYVLIIYGTGQSLGTANVTVTSTAVTNASATSPLFNTTYTVGDFVRIGDEVRQVISITNANNMVIDAPLNGSGTDVNHYTVTEKYDLLRVESANSTSITVNRPPLYTVNSTMSASLQKVVKGTVDVYNANKGKLYLKDSNSANSTFLIRQANSTYKGYIFGDSSNGVATVVSIDNVPGTIFTPLINTLVVPSTTISFNSTFTKLGGGSDTQSYVLGTKNNIPVNDTAIIKSKSNEISGTTVNKSFTATLGLSSAFTDTSPVIDINPSSIVIQKYNINNDSTNENTRYGEALCKYISKRLILNDGLDAEDIKVFVRAYKPFGTDIEVYAKILNSADGEPFNDKDWSKLEQVTSTSLYSSSLDENNLKEYEYTFKRSPTSRQLAGKITTNSNTTVTGTGTQFYATFNANTDVNEATDFISISSNLFADGDLVTYSVSSGNTAISGLIPNKNYYVVSSNSSGVKISLTTGGSAIELTKGATEAGHKLSTITTGSLVKLVKSNTLTDYDILAVQSVDSTGQITLTSNASFSGSGFTLEQVQKPKEAFKYVRNSNIVRYFDSSNANFDTYKYLAIKLVLKSENTYLVPQIDDVRAIAVSV